MRCPFCRKAEGKVIDSRGSDEGSSIRRRRECLGCRKRFTTYERVEEMTLYVVKKDGRRQLFDRHKIKNGILTACKKRPVPIEVIEDIVSRIEQDLAERNDREVQSKLIGSLVMRELKRFDHVAYVRFASVYCEFQDAREFVKEVKPILKRRRMAVSRS